MMMMMEVMLGGHDPRRGGVVMGDETNKQTHTAQNPERDGRR